MSLGNAISLGFTPGGGWYQYVHVDPAETNLFVDLNLATGLNDGTSWANAYQTWADFQANNNDSTVKDVYVKAGDHIERTPLKYNGMAGKRLYLNATGVGTELGSKRSWYFGSQQVDLATAALVSGTTYKVTGVTDAGGVLAANDGASKYGVWLCSNASTSNEFYYGSVTSLIGASPYNNTPASGRYYYDDVADELYFNIGRAPIAGEYLEIMKENMGLECYDFGDVMGGIFRFANSGHDNGNCSGWWVFNCDFSYNALFGFDTAADPDDGDGGPSLVEACTINYNGSTGVNIDQLGESITVRFCTIIGNVSNGWRDRGIVSADANYCYNNVITGSVNGIYVGNGSEVQNHVVYNNIVWGNTTDIYAVNDANNTLDYDYNAAETFGGKAAQQANDITVDPAIQSDGSILVSSSAYQEGKTDLYSEAVYDINTYVVTTDAGVIKFYISLGAFIKL
jgi:hypothetical protein